jgi:hypothetical protein
VSNSLGGTSSSAAVARLPVTVFNTLTDVVFRCCGSAFETVGPMHPDRLLFRHRIVAPLRRQYPDAESRKGQNCRPARRQGVSRISSSRRDSARSLRRTSAAKAAHSDRAAYARSSPAALSSSRRERSPARWGRTPAAPLPRPPPRRRLVGADVAAQHVEGDRAEHERGAVVDVGRVDPDMWPMRWAECIERRPIELVFVEPA